MVCLTKCGVPFDVAWDMVETPEYHPMILAWIVIAGELEGGEFDWKGLKWKEPEDIKRR